jgi:type III pantothenate kinase
VLENVANCRTTGFSKGFAMLLTIDCGNTRTKWALFNSAGEITHENACLNTELMTIDLSPTSLNYQRAIISNVSGEQYVAVIKKNLGSNIATHWLKSTSQIAGVSNHYNKPDTLGCDRWAALVAAWHIKQAPCVVVNAGTAVTIDALTINNNQAAFIGGLILPGLTLMQQSLGQATAQLPVANSAASATPQSNDSFPKNTVDAIYTGALQAITGAITLMSHKLQAECKQLPYILISGGNAQTIKDSLVSDANQQALVVDHLVLRGLYLIDQFMQSERAI